MARNLDNVKGYEIQGHHDLQLAGLFDESVRNVTEELQPSKNLSRQIQKVVSKQRRFSPRLKQMPESKRPYYGSPRKKLLHCPIYAIRKRKGNSVCSDHIKTSDYGVKSKLHTGNDSRQNFAPIDIDLGVDEVSDGDSIFIDAYASSTTSSESGKIQLSSSEKDMRKWTISTTSLSVDGKSDHAKVKKAMKLYHKYYLQAVQEEDNRCSTNANELEPEERDACGENRKRPVKRPDLKAVSKMRETNAILYPEKRFGHLPGIDVGYQFYSRAAMVALGIHSHWLWGIDYVGKSSKDYKEHELPLAVAIVMSGCYEDDQDNKEDIIYTGQGGNDFLGKKHQVKDQEMSRGNLALRNNKENFIPVRVVRGHKIDGNNVYTYDGLYEVVKDWKEIGVSGFVVYKYCLRRIPGQPQLTTNQVHFINGRASHISSTKTSIVCEDISGGQEKIPIRVINEVDDTPAPIGFTYSKSNQIGENVKLPSNAPGCECIGTCSNRKTCACARLNGSDFPYVRPKEGGRLVEAKDVVYECGPNCGCGPQCINRISQQGIKYQLEIFQTPNKGWAVRTLELIPSGALVCEYTGILRRSDELDNVDVNDYIMEIDCLQTMKGMGGRQKRVGNISASFTNPLEQADDITDENPEFSIDAGSTGNVSRFINHSCDPNLFVQCLLNEHHDPRLARVFLVASDNIPPLQELSYDYNYELNSVADSNNNVKELPCHCGADDCRKRLY